LIQIFQVRLYVTCRSIIWLISIEHNGAFLQDCHVADPWTETVKPWATSAVEAEKLWKMSEQLVGQKFDY
jgi:hypothetical protein